MAKEFVSLLTGKVMKPPELKLAAAADPLHYVIEFKNDSEELKALQAQFTTFTQETTSALSAMMAALKEMTAALQKSTQDNAQAIADLTQALSAESEDTEDNGMQALCDRIDALCAMEPNDDQALQDRLDRIERAITGLAKPPIPKPPTYVIDVVRGADGKTKSMVLKPKE